jgi:hypothetical protein
MESRRLGRDMGAMKRNGMFPSTWGFFWTKTPVFEVTFPILLCSFFWANAAVFSLYRREAQHEFIDNFLGWRPFTIRPALTSIEAF